MLLIDNQTNQNIDTSKLEHIYESLTDREIELIFVTNEQIRDINLEHRGKDKPTDVLSFPLIDMPHAPLGSIIISLDMAKDVSQKLNHRLEDEVSLLFIHGFLHLSGYDHEVDGGEMREKEEELIGEFGLPNSLIVRTMEE